MYAKLGIGQGRLLIGKQMGVVMIAQDAAIQIREDLLSCNEGIQVMGPQASHFSHQQRDGDAWLCLHALAHKSGEPFRDHRRGNKVVGEKVEVINVGTW